ncbi:auxilin-like protein 1 [Abeliophyllum distichum]|uniref:Auxilin-like protein 1 n=1 Tax=Abeliophyllum distichum TaxID=126358 RepID=A0ABD1SBA0_9LAMI
MVIPRQGHISKNVRERRVEKYVFFPISKKLFTPPHPHPTPPHPTKVAPSLGQKEPTFNAGKIEVEKLQENVEAAEERAEPRSSPGLETNAESRIATLGSVQVNNSNNSVHSMNKLLSDTEEIETIEKTLDRTEVVFDHTKGPANVVELGDPGRFDKKISGASHRVQEMEEIVDEVGEHLRISEDDAGTEEKRNVFDENEKYTEKFEGHWVIVNGEEIKLQKLVLDHLLKGWGGVGWGGVGWGGTLI